MFSVHSTQIFMTRKIPSSFRNFLAQSATQRSASRSEGLEGVRLKSAYIGGFVSPLLSL